MGFSVRIDRDACMSSGTCVADAPEAFALDDDDIAVIRPGVGDLADDRILRIARNCPAGAIVVLGSAGNEVDLFA